MGLGLDAGQKALHRGQASGASLNKDGLPTLMQKLSAQLNQHWPLNALATEAGCNPENLRRSCQEDLGRSPMAHLKYLRMHRATELLAKTSLKLTVIVCTTGYRNSQILAKVFFGCPGHLEQP